LSSLEHNSKKESSWTYTWECLKKRSFGDIVFLFLYFGSTSTSHMYWYSEERRHQTWKRP
jgi:hypothetical protein